AGRALGVSTGERPIAISAEPATATPAWRRLLLPVGVAAVVIAAVVAIVLATRGGGHAPAPSPKAAAGVTSQVIERIDLSSGKVVATVRLGHPTHGDRISQNI